MTRNEAIELAIKILRYFDKELLKGWFTNMLFDERFGVDNMSEKIPQIITILEGLKDAKEEE